MLYSPKSIKNKTTQKLYLYIICLLERAEVADAIQMLFALASLWHSGQGHHVKGSLLERGGTKATLWYPHLNQI